MQYACVGALLHPNDDKPQVISASIGGGFPNALCRLQTHLHQGQHRDYHPRYRSR
jgi:hypothetical protein